MSDEDLERRRVGRSPPSEALLDIVLPDSYDDEQFYYCQALELCRLLLSVGHPESVTDLASRCTYFQVSTNVVEFLCLIPNSPISLIDDGFTVTLSSELLSAPASFACSLGVPENILFEQITHFVDSRTSKPKPNVLGHMRENDEQEELQLMPLPKRSRKDVRGVYDYAMDSKTNGNTIIANGSMLEALMAFESQVSHLKFAQGGPYLVQNGSNANATEQNSADARKIVAVDHYPRSGPRTRLFGCEIFSNCSVEVDPLLCLEENKQNSASPPEVGDCKLLEIEDLRTADNQILMEDAEDKNVKDMVPMGEIQAHSMHTNLAASSRPPEDALRSEYIVEDTDDMRVLSCNPPKQEDPVVDVLPNSDREVPVKPSTTRANQDKSLMPKTQGICKSFGNSEAYSFSPEKQKTKIRKAIQKPTQNINSVRPKDQKGDASLSSKDQLERNAFPDFESYIIVEEEGSGGYGIVYKAKRKTDGTKFAIKCPHAGAQKHYVNNELRMLERFGGKNFIIKYEGCVKNGDSDCFILEHLEHDRPDLLKREIDVYQLQWYGYCMFKALSTLHNQGVVHRDIKPGNFLFSRKTNKGCLIDFNLAVDLHQKYRRADKSKAPSDFASNHPNSQRTKSFFPTATKKHHTLVKSPDARNRATNKPSHAALAPNSLKKAAGKMRAQNELSRWDRFSQGAEGSGLTSTKDMTSIRNNPSGDKKREPLPSHGRKELLKFLQTTMAGPVPDDEVSSKAPTSMRKRVAALPGKAERELLYLTPMPLRSKSQAQAGADITRELFQKKEGPCSGTKGFRAPEVCFRSSHQGPKIDIWSAGVTLLYLMIGKTPFIGDPEQNLKDIAKLRGSEDLWEVAKLHNRESSFPEELYDTRYLKGMDLREWCRINTKRREFLDAIPPSLLDLVGKCLTVNPRLRISAEDALKHDFFYPIHENLRKQKLQQQQQTQTQTRLSMPVVDEAVGLTPN